LFVLFLDGILIFHTHVGYLSFNSLRASLGDFFAGCRANHTCILVRCLYSNRFGNQFSKVRYRALVHHNAFSYLSDLRKVPSYNCCCNDDQKHDACDASTQDSTMSLLFVLLCKPFIPAITCQHPFFVLLVVDSVYVHTSYQRWSSHFSVIPSRHLPEPLPCEQRWRTSSS